MADNNLLNTGKLVELVPMSVDIMGGLKVYRAGNMYFSEDVSQLTIYNRNTALAVNDFWDLIPAAQGKRYFIRQLQVISATAATIFEWYIGDYKIYVSPSGTGSFSLSLSSEGMLLPENTPFRMKNISAVPVDVRVSANGCYISV